MMAQTVVKEKKKGGVGGTKQPSKKMIWGANGGVLRAIGAGGNRKGS